MRYHAVLGVSSDDVASHVEFKSQLSLPFRLLADEGSRVRRQWGIPKDLLGLLEGRQTYVIGELLITRLTALKLLLSERQSE